MYINAKASPLTDLFLIQGGKTGQLRILYLITFPIN